MAADSTIDHDKCISKHALRVSHLVKPKSQVQDVHMAWHVPYCAVFDSAA